MDKYCNILLILDACKHLLIFTRTRVQSYFNMRYYKNDENYENGGIKFKDTKKAHNARIENKNGVQEIKGKSIEI